MVSKSSTTSWLRCASGAGEPALSGWASLRARTRSRIPFKRSWSVSAAGWRRRRRPRRPSRPRRGRGGGWPNCSAARAEQADLAKRHKQYERAHELLDQALPGGPVQPALRATVAHYRGALLCHQDRPDAALAHLHEALELFGKEHFLTGRVLDTLGMAYAAKDTFTTAREFFERAIECKEACQDQHGLALSHGQLGRLALDWGDPAEAEKHLLADLELCLVLGDDYGAAVMYAERGEAALAAGRLGRAADLLDEAIRRGRDGELFHVEGYAHKDRALVHLANGHLLAARQEPHDAAREFDQAEKELQAAEHLFREHTFKEGLGHVNRARGQLLRVRGQFDEAERRWARRWPILRGRTNGPRLLAPSGSGPR